MRPTSRGSESEGLVGVGVEAMRLAVRPPHQREPLEVRVGAEGAEVSRTSKGFQIGRGERQVSFKVDVRNPVR